MANSVNISKIRVVIVLWSGNYGGVERSVQWFAQHADRNKFDYYYLFLHSGGVVRDAISSLGFLTYVLEWQSGFTLGGRIRLLKKILEIKPQIIHDQSQSPLIRIFMKMVSRAKIISTQHGFFPSEKREKNKLFFKLDDLVTDLVIANSNFTAQKHSSFFKRLPEKIKTIYLGVNPDKYKNEAANQIPVKTLHLIFIGRLEDFKGSLHIPLLARELKDHEQSFLLTVIGDGPLMGECKQLAAKLGVSENIRYLGWVSDVENILHNSHALVSLSLCDESFGFVPIEALAAGMPVFAYSSGAIVETIEKSPYGWIVPKGDYKKMSKLIIDNKNQYLNCNKLAGYQYVKENFNIIKTVADVESVYREHSGI